MSVSPPDATILVVDDDPDIRNLLKRMLSTQGHGVITAQDGAEAIVLISTVHPDLLLVDVGLPDIDGAALCRSLKEGHDTRDIPVILMSASADLMDLEQASRADAILRKPFNRDELHLWVRSLILARWATRSLEHAEAVCPGTA
jgi:CheY-like chemotaxis protein